MAFGLACRINSCSRFLTLHQCLRNNLARHRNISCGGFDFVAKVSLVRCKPNTFECQALSKPQWKWHFLSKRHQCVKYLGCRSYCKEGDKCKNDGKCVEGKPKEKLNLYQRLKALYKEYWYVLAPVHLITSLAWLGGFYILLLSGVDIPSLLEKINVSQSWVDKLRNSKTGNFIFVYTLYKIATPLRYTVTLSLTTVSINYLKRWGWIKPNQLKEMYARQAGAFQDLKASCQDKMQVTKNEILKTKKEMKQHYIDAKEELHKSVKETKEGFKEGCKSASDEWKLIGRLGAKSTKEAWNSFIGKK